MRNSNLSSQELTRRRFLYSAAVIGGSSVFSTEVLARAKPKRLSPNEKLNIAIIGAGGRGAANTKEVSGENIVALCDVNEANLNKAAEKFPRARTHVDFRKLFDEANDIDAVVVSTAEQTHAFATMMANRKS